MRIAFYTLGCKVNQYETQAMSEKMTQAGFSVVSSNETADVYVVNSCTVTASGDKKTRQAVRRFKRNNPGCTVVLTGCMPQAYPEKVKELAEADIIIGNKNNDQLPELLCEYYKSHNRKIDIIPHCSGDIFQGGTISAFNERTRAFVKIQDGCNRFCSYCIIPYSRGRVRSKPIETIKTEIAGLARSGYKEIVLVGINLSSYGSDTGHSFYQAVEAACSIDKIERVRLGSLEPDHITDEVIEQLARLPKLCPQFHISLQSGCDATLKRMNRHYTADEYRALCRKLRDSFIDTVLTTDVMVGFSLESDAEFEESLRFVQEMAFEKVHVFPYSVRKGTKAENLPQIEDSVKERRAKRMIQETEKIRQAFLQRQVNRETEILIESNRIGHLFEGYTKNYTPVLVDCDESLTSTIQRVLITGTGKDYCTGMLIR